MIQRTFEAASSALGKDNVAVATDDERIFNAVVSFGGTAIMTSVDHKSGTDRCLEAFEKLEVTDDDIVINIQGDEPFLQCGHIESLKKCFDDSRTQIATLARNFSGDFKELSNPNSPKVVTDVEGYALYFSRSVIPFIRGKETSVWPEKFPYKTHIGIYAFRGEVLRKICALPQSSLEKAESLEQLRWLENGFRIKVELTDLQNIGIDTPEDLVLAEKLFQNQ